jgi:adenylate kinase family enzyme
VNLESASVDRLLRSQRILVLGSSGVGKTSLSLRLAALLDLPLIHLDAEFWQPGWVPTPKPEWRERVHALASQPAWIIDGTYEQSLELRVPRAEAILVLRASRLKCLWGVFQRRIRLRGRERPDAPAKQPLDWAFIRYVWCYPSRSDPLIERTLREHGAELRAIELDGEIGARTLLARVAARAAGPEGHAK